MTHCVALVEQKVRSPYRKYCKAAMLDPHFPVGTLIVGDVFAVFPTGNLVNPTSKYKDLSLSFLSSFWK